MARSIKEIIIQMNLQQAAQPELAKLNSPSQTAIYTLWKYIMAVGLYVHETLWDLFKVQLETSISNAPIATEGWLQQESFKFQYDSTNPQILQLINFVPTYNPVDATKQLITQCSVTTLPSKIVSFKVAKSSPPQKLVTAELVAYQGYLNNIVPAGIGYTAVSRDPDLLYVDATITYDGQYSTSISSTTSTAIDNYCTSIPFDGYFKLISLTDAIQKVSGITDVVLNAVAIRPNTTGFSGATYLVLSATTIYSSFPLTAGYIVQDAFPHDFATTLTFIPK